MNQERALKYMQDLLKLMVSKKASDLFIADDLAPSMKIDGKLTPVANQKRAGAHTRLFAEALMARGAWPPSRSCWGPGSSPT